MYAIKSEAGWEIWVMLLFDLNILYYSYVCEQKQQQTTKQQKYNNYKQNNENKTKQNKTNQNKNTSSVWFRHVEGHLALTMK